MELVNRINLKENDVLKWSKELVLKEFPISDKLDEARTLWISIYFEDDETKIEMYSNHQNEGSRKQLSELGLVNEYISPETIEDIVDFFVKDNKCLNYYKFHADSKLNDDSLSLIFLHNFSDKALKRMPCDTVLIRMYFGGDFDLSDEYGKKIYRDILTNSEYSDLPWHDKFKEDYISDQKNKFFDSASDDEITDFVSEMNVDELRSLLTDAHNDTFVSYLEKKKKKSKVLNLLNKKE